MKPFFVGRKYRNRPVLVGEHRFPSKREADRYLQLLNAEKAGVIQNLEVHPRFDLIVNGMKIGTYTADFRYEENGQVVVEDVKGFKTKEYNRTKKLMKAIYNIDIKET